MNLELILPWVRDHSRARQRFLTFTQGMGSQVCAAGVGGEKLEISRILKKRPPREEQEIFQ